MPGDWLSSGGAPGVKDDPGDCIGSAMMACDYERREYDPVFFAACLFYCLVRGHRFVDGNNRVAWSALCTVLSTMRLRIEAETETAERFVLAVTTGDLARPAAVAWICARLVDERA